MLLATAASLPSFEMSSAKIKPPTARGLFPFAINGDTFMSTSGLPVNARRSANPGVVCLVQSPTTTVIASFTTVNDFFGADMRLSADPLSLVPELWSRRAQCPLPVQWPYQSCTVALWKAGSRRLLFPAGSYSTSYCGHHEETVCGPRVLA